MASRFVLPDLPEALAAIEVLRVHLPLVEPFVASHGTEVVRDLVLVRAIGVEGNEGWGECEALSQATYTSEDSESAWGFLTQPAVRRALSAEPLDIAGHPMAWTAIEVALLDLALRREGVSLAAHVGATRREVVCAAVVGRQPGIDALLGVVGRRIDEGASSIKLKIGHGWDVEPLRAVREAFPAVPLCADANGAYTMADVELLRSIDRLELAYLEQPLAPDDVADFNDVNRRLSTPLALDESVATADDLDRFGRAGLVVNVKPSRLGGVREAQRVIDRCVSDGLGCFIGGMLEGGIGRAVALALAGIDTLTLPTDLGPSSRYFTDDITEPFVLRDRALTVPDGPGIGVAPRADRLESVVVDRVMIDR